MFKKGDRIKPIKQNDDPEAYRIPDLNQIYTVLATEGKYLFIKELDCESYEKLGYFCFQDQYGPGYNQILFKKITDIDANIKLVQDALKGIL